MGPALGRLQDLPAADRTVLAGQCPGLAGHLAAVPDPRDPRGVRHTLTSLLLAAAASVLAGARSFTEIGEWAADAPPRVLAALGARYDPLARVFQPPDETTFRRVLEAVGPAALEAAVGSWLAARRQASCLPPGPGPGRRERRAVAVDGKAVRGTRHASSDGQARHLLAAADQQAGAVLTQAEADGKTNEITCFAPLLAPLDHAGAVVTADTLHTQAIQIRRRRKPLAGPKRWPAQTSYAVTSLAASQADPAQLAGWIRGHRGIEALHHIRDVTYGEDASQIRTGHGPQVIAALRNLGIAILKPAGHPSAAAACRYHARDATRVLATLGLSPP